jgi:hypothetical protein
MQMSRFDVRQLQRFSLKQASQTTVSEPVEPKASLPAVPCESRWDFRSACYLRLINGHLGGSLSCRCRFTHLLDTGSTHARVRDEVRPAAQAGPEETG